MAILEVEILIYLLQIVQIADLEWNKAYIKISTKYSDYANVFLINWAIELPENTGINKYAIKLIERKQPLHGLIYTLNLVKLKILKTYI